MALHERGLRNSSSWSDGAGFPDVVRDENGVALAAIQGLNAKVEEQQREINELRRIVLEMRSTNRDQGGDALTLSLSVLDQLAQYAS